MIGIIYSRVSSTDQVQGTSLENQKEACLRYAAEKDITIAEVFVERGESATVANRTELLRALDYCRKNKGRLQAFIVWKLDRFARNTTDHYALQAELRKYGVSLYSVTEPIGDDPIGRMTEAVLAGYAQFENDIRKQRCEGGLRRKLVEGIWPWVPPLGYLHAKKLTDRRKTRPDEPDPQRFPLLQQALKRYALGGLSIVELAALMNRLGLRTRTGGPIYKQLAERLLTGKYYAGVLVDPWTKLEHRGLHQAMISLEEYQAIQYVKASARHRPPHRVRANPDFPLRRFVACACGRPLTGAWHSGRSRQYAYYLCHSPSCQLRGRAIPGKLLEDRFVARLRSISPAPYALDAFSHIVFATLSETTAAQSKHAARGETERARVQERKSRIIQMRADEEISHDDFRLALKQADQQLATLSPALPSSPISESTLRTGLTLASPLVLHTADAWAKATRLEHRQQLQSLVFPQGIVFDQASGTYRIAQPSLIFRLSRLSPRRSSYAVAGVRPNLNRIAHDIMALASLSRELLTPDGQLRLAT
jgi:site-specific DNA recombinase